MFSCIQRYYFKSRQAFEFSVMSFEPESKFLLESSNKLDHKFDESSTFMPFGQRSTNLHQLDLFFPKNHNLMLDGEHSVNTNRGILVTSTANANSNQEAAQPVSLKKPDESKDKNRTTHNGAPEPRRTRSRKVTPPYSPVVITQATLDL